MKASEMTNEELAKALMSRIPLDSDRHDDLREAAARLRLKQQPDNYAAELCRQGVEYKREICDFRRRLKVAEDALRKLQECLVASVYSGTIDPHEALKIAEDAIAAMLEEGGEE